MVEHGHFGKAGQEHLNEVEELAKEHTGDAYGQERQLFSVYAKGGISMGGEWYGGHNYRVDLARVE